MRRPANPWEPKSFFGCHLFPPPPIVHLATVSDVTPEVRAFVRQHIPSMDHLEVLMRLHGQPEHAFTHHELHERTHLDDRTLGLCLDALARSELLKQAGEDGFQYAPRTVALREDVNAVATLYHQRPVTLVKLVYEQPSSSRAPLTESGGKPYFMEPDT